MLLILLAACSSAPRARVLSAVDARDRDAALRAYERVEAVDGSDVELLGAIGALHLEIEAESDDEARSRAAVTQLALGGNAAKDALRRVSRNKATSSVTRARALRALAQRGDARSSALLFGLADHSDPAVRALALSTADPDADRQRLAKGLTHGSADERREAALRLGEAEEIEESTLMTLRRVARVDGEASVRSAVVSALGGLGSRMQSSREGARDDATWDTVRERLSDPASPVRLAAVRALVQIDRARAAAVIATLLSGPPNSAAIEAARVLALTGAQNRDPATRSATGGSATDVEGASGRAFLHGVLLAPGSSHRAQAAVALVSLPPDPSTDTALRRALENENDPTVRLGVARALASYPGSEDAAQEVLVELMTGDGMAAAQAALLVAARSDEAIERVQHFMAEGEPIIRRVAARGLARDLARPNLARAALRDEDPLVAIHAAGGLVAAASAN